MADKKRKHDAGEESPKKQAKLAGDGTDQTATLFVSKLPTSLTSLQLTTLFSSYSPIRSAFVVSTSSASDKNDSAIGSNAIPLKTKDRTAQSRGFGYVKFVLRQDADNCLKDWSAGIPKQIRDECEDKEEMKEVNWSLLSKLKLDWAKRKLHKDESAPSVPAQEQQAQDAKLAPHSNQRKEKASWPFDPDGARTVLIHGLPLGESSSEEGADIVDWIKTVKHKCRKLFVPESVTILDLPTGEKAVSVLCHTSREAHQLIEKTHNHVLKNYIVTALSKSSWDLVERKGKAQGGRLLIRNLAFDVTEEDLRCVFAPFGGLHSIHIPQASPSPSAATSKGFAFVHFVHRTDAEKAITAVNATRVRKGIARDRAETEGGKLGNKKQARELKKAQSGGEDGQQAQEKGRLVAVDWALSKDEWKKQSGSMPVDEPVADDTAGNEDEAASLHGRTDGDSDEEDSDEEDEDEDEDEDEEDDDDSDLEPIGLDETKPIKAGDADAAQSDDEDDEPVQHEEKGSTLFVRNISFESTEPELYDLFKKFGPVRYARIVFDQKTNRSRGTAFVCFWNDADAAHVRALSDEVNSIKDAVVASSSKTVLMPDPTSSTASQLTLHGRVLAVSSAVSKERADKLREDRDKQKGATSDRRNLYLMREGVIFPDHPLSRTLVPSDLDARQASYETRKSLLRSNPSLFISRTRLSIRQIPLYVTDGMLKRLANHAIRAFEKDASVKKLTAEEKEDDIKQPGRNAVKKDAIPDPKVRQSKILRQADRVDPLTGMGRSKGYGFLELDCHANALRVLRWANANRQVGTMFRKWWRDELERLIKKEQDGSSHSAKDKDEKDKGKGRKNGVTIRDSAERVKRLKEKLDELKQEEDEAAAESSKKKGSTRSTKSLIIEFSIENAQTTKRRAEKIERARERSRRQKERVEAGDNEEEEPASNGGKKRKAGADDGPRGKKQKRPSSTKQGVDAAPSAASTSSAPDKLGNKIGGLIGKKRKMRKQKGGK